MPWQSAGGSVSQTRKALTMRFLAMLLLLTLSSAAVADTNVYARKATIVSAQDHALVLARRGTLVHSHCNQTEGIGCGSTAEIARRNCCYFGKRQIVEEGVAYSPTARKWFAVIRYR
jgi:hypothetical protein